MSDKVSADSIVIKREFDASTELVWQMWTDPEHFKQWYGPRGFTIPVAEWDLVVGGKRLVCMQGETPNGPMTMWTTGEHLEIEPNQRLVYTESFSDEKGTVISAADMGFDPGYPDATQVTVLLEDLGGRTRMTMTHVGVPSSAEGASEGWSQSFEKMAEYLESKAA